MGESHGHHIVPAKTYNKVLYILLGLTVLTVLAAQVHFGPGMHTFLALAIATVKACFVGAIFMNLKYDDRMYTMILLTAVFFLILLYSFAMLDIFTRIPVQGTI